MNRKRKFLLLFVSICQLSALTAFGQTISISGKLSLATSGKAVSGADVFIQSTSIQTTTNQQGRYEFPPLPEGKYAVAIFALGYKSQVKEVEGSPGNQITVDFQLEELENMLDELTILEQQARMGGIGRLRSVEGTAIYEAKKSEVIVMSELTANKATNNSRQIYSRVPGLNIWESDGAGIQLGIGGRGLSPNRTSNFNTRQNGYDISADALGYPESYYTPPAEAIEKIQIVRGAASLQYGTQFGGMINFVMKKGPSNTPLELTSRQTIGSFGLFNSYNSIGGSVGKMDYYTFYQRKQGNGWRPNSGFEVNTFFTDFNFQLTDKLFLCFEYTHMDYLAQQAGGLTDADFLLNPRQSLRDRNWFKVNWNLGAILMEYKFSTRTRLEMKNFGLLAGRDALGDLNPINRNIDANRKLIQDTFRNFGNETRILHHYSLAGKPGVALAGVRYYQGITHKMQGYADEGHEANFRYLNPDSLLADHHFPNRNLAFFVENIFTISDQLTITPGLRYEYIDTRADGTYQENWVMIDENGLSKPTTVTKVDIQNRERTVWLAGLGISYKPHTKTELYANISQNYRAINFTDLRSINPNFHVDPNLKDETGYSADLGMRGSNKWFQYDLSLFYLKYNDKIGTAPDVRNGIPTRVRRNISDAYTTGIESFAEVDLLQLLNTKSSYGLSVFTNIALIEGKYVDSELKVFQNKEVELVPTYNIKTGLNFRKGDFSSSFQWSYVSEQFTDATNEEKIGSAIIGRIPSYYVFDLSLQYYLKQFIIEGGLNNLANNYYFTRRAEGYPGPGIIPSDGRSFYLTLGYKFQKK